MPTLFILENDVLRIEAMQDCIRQSEVDFAATFIDNVPDAVRWLSRNLGTCSVISLDHDLGAVQVQDGQSFDPGSGRDIANYLAERSPVCPVIIHTDNFFIRPRMQSILTERSWSHTYVAPGNGVGWVSQAWMPKVLSLLDRRQESPA